MPIKVFMKNLLFYFIYALSSCTVVSQTPKNTSNIITPSHSNIKYGANNRNTMDIYLAKSTSPTPLVIYIHGGGFIQGNKELKDNMVKVVTELHSKGISFASINYPYIQEMNLDEIMLNIGRSVQFIRAHSEQYNIQKEKIALLGFSAGAGAALWLNYYTDLKNSQSQDLIERESSKPLCVAAVSPQASYNIHHWGAILQMDQDRVEKALEKKEMFPYFEQHVSKLNDKQQQDFWNKMDILKHIDHKDGPVFLLNNQPDKEFGNLLHHPKHCEAIKKTAEQKGNSVTYFYASDGKMAPGQKQMLQFLLKNLKN